MTLRLITLRFPSARRHDNGCPQANGCGPVQGQQSGSVPMEAVGTSVIVDLLVSRSPKASTTRQVFHPRVPARMQQPQRFHVYPRVPIYPAFDSSRISVIGQESTRRNFQRGCGAASPPSPLNPLVAPRCGSIRERMSGGRPSVQGPIEGRTHSDDSRNSWKDPRLRPHCERYAPAMRRRPASD